MNCSSVTFDGKSTHRVTKPRMYCNRVRSRKKGAETNCWRQPHGTGPIGWVSPPLFHRWRPAPCDAGNEPQ
jgi:hypothetical protein